MSIRIFRLFGELRLYIPWVETMHNSLLCCSHSSFFSHMLSHCSDQWLPNLSSQTGCYDIMLLPSDTKIDLFKYLILAVFYGLLFEERLLYFYHIPLKSSITVWSNIAVFTTLWSCTIKYTNPGKSIFIAQCVASRWVPLFGVSLKMWNDLFPDRPS